MNGRIKDEIKKEEKESKKGNKNRERKGKGIQA
jgi:hypothetical protein